MSTEPDNLLAVLRDAWTQSPHRLLSLRDMIQATIQPFCFMTDLEGKRQVALRATEVLGAGQISEWDVTYGLEAGLEELKMFCESIDLPATADRAFQFWARLSCAESTGEPITNELISSQIEDIQCSFWRELGARKIVFMSPLAESYFEQEALFGRTVERLFPGARQDIKDAGSCIAAELNTSAVFHLMRVLEFGLRALARNLKVGKVKKHVPIEFATWDEILNELWKKIEEQSVKTRGHKRQKMVDFYHGAWRELKTLKDIRNKTMHTRGPFSEAAAMDAFNVVRDFMRRLADFGIKG